MMNLLKPPATQNECLECKLYIRIWLSSSWLWVCYQLTQYSLACSFCNLNPSNMSALSIIHLRRHSIGNHVTSNWYVSTILIIQTEILTGQSEVILNS